MKSLVLKDLFNIGHNAKSMLFILVVFAVALIPFSGVEGYIFVCAILCSMMIVTTFSFEQRLFGKGKDKQAEIQYSCGFAAGWLPKS